MHFVESTTLISEVLSNRADHRFQIETWAKSEASGAYSGGA